MNKNVFVFCEQRDGEIQKVAFELVGKARELALSLIHIFPGTLLAICVSSMLGNGIWQTAVAVAVGGIAPSCRMMRALSLIHI